MSVLEPEAYAAALSGFHLMNVQRLLALFRHHRPDEAWAVAVGDAPPTRGGLIERVLRDPQVRDAWRTSARQMRPEAVWSRCAELGLEVSIIGGARHPAVLAADRAPSPVLFSLGDRSLLEGRRVAIVGTRNATATGRRVAHEFGGGLACAGVHVLSGLARGIDGQAHRGVLDQVANGATGRPVAVVACGLDVVYPREHRALWQEVGAHGLMLSESPPGMAPAAHRFPLRNRIIAALAEVVVVVESRERGGSLITATQAIERGIPVMAVPGSAANRAALGANELIRDGSAPALDVADVLLALSIDHARAGPVLAEQRVRPRAADVAAYRTCAERPVTIGEVAEAGRIELLEAAMSLARLEQAGWIAQVDGWYEAVGSPLR